MPRRNDKARPVERRTKIDPELVDVAGRLFRERLGAGGDVLAGSRELVRRHEPPAERRVA
ncbi:MAG: hypothetical protein ACJ76I_12020 [Gaiellaceae bacterium]